MKKLLKLYKAFILLLKKPYLINNIIDDNGVFKSRFSKKYNFDKGLPQIDLSLLFPEFKIIVEPYAYLEGGSTTMDLALLKALAIKYNVKDLKVLSKIY